MLNGFNLGVQQDWDPRDASRGTAPSELDHTVHLIQLLNASRILNPS